MVFPLPNYIVPGSVYTLCDSIPLMLNLCIPVLMLFNGLGLKYSLCMMDLAQAQPVHEMLLTESPVSVDA